MLKRWMMIAGLALLVLGIPLVSLRVRTVRAIARIEVLRGYVGDFAEITRPIRTRYSQVVSEEGLEHARFTMELPTVSNLLGLRFNGEGLPYFYGFVAYDTNRQEVVRAVVDQLW
jgi:hypothetical protein